MNKISKILLVILIFNFLIIANVFAVDKSDITVNERKEYSANKVEYTTIEQAGIQLREGLKSRNKTIQVTYITNIKLDDSIIKQVVNEAVKHTGVPTEGDYIYWQCSEWEADYNWEYLNGTYYYTLTYIFSYYTTYEQEREMDIAVANLLNTLDLSGTDYEKITKIYNYMCNNIIYNYSSKDDSIYSAYGALINKKAVCQGFATLFYRLALENNIDARVISGIADGGPHGWNIVKVGNQYYNIDTTWDANNIKSGYKYCMVTDNNFTDHKRDNTFSSSEFYNSYPMGSENYILENCENDINEIDNNIDMNEVDYISEDNDIDMNEIEIIKTDYIADLESEEDKTYVENSEVTETGYKKDISYITKNNKVIENILKNTNEIFKINNVWRDIIYEYINYNYIRIGKNKSEV